MLYGSQNNLGYESFGFSEVEPPEDKPGFLRNIFYKFKDKTPKGSNLNAHPEIETKNSNQNLDTSTNMKKKLLLSAVNNQLLSFNNTQTSKRRYWMLDENCKNCFECGLYFTTIRRKHHCRVCGRIFCNQCSNHFIEGSFIGLSGLQRACRYCAEVVCITNEVYDHPKVESQASPSRTHRSRAPSPPALINEDTLYQTWNSCEYQPTAYQLSSRTISYNNLNSSMNDISTLSTENCDKIYNPHLSMRKISLPIRSSYDDHYYKTKQNELLKQKNNPSFIKNLSDNDLICLWSTIWEKQNSAFENNATVSDDHDVDHVNQSDDDHSSNKSACNLAFSDESAKPLKLFTVKQGQSTMYCISGLVLIEWLVYNIQLMKRCRLVCRTLCQRFLELGLLIDLKNPSCKQFSDDFTVYIVKQLNEDSKLNEENNQELCRSQSKFKNISNSGSSQCLFKASDEPDWLQDIKENVNAVQSNAMLDDYYYHQHQNHLQSNKDSKLYNLDHDKLSDDDIVYGVDVNRLNDFTIFSSELSLDQLKSIPANDNSEKLGSSRCSSFSNADKSILSRNSQTSCTANNSTSKSTISHSASFSISRPTPSHHHHQHQHNHYDSNHINNINNTTTTNNNSKPIEQPKSLVNQSSCISEQFKSIRFIYDSFIHKLVTQELRDFAIDDKWIPILIHLAWRVCQTVKFDLRTSGMRQQLRTMNLNDADSEMDNGDNSQFNQRRRKKQFRIYSTMDIRHYVHIKKLTHATDVNSDVFPGTIFTKRVTHKQMALLIDNPRLLILDSSITYQRTNTKMAWFESHLMQEEEYIINCISKILSLHPNLMFVSGNVSCLARNLLFKAGVTLLCNVKRSVLFRISRITNAHIFDSIDRIINISRSNNLDSAAITHLGTCRRFEIKELHLSNGSVKFLTYIENNPLADGAGVDATNSLNRRPSTCEATVLLCDPSYSTLVRIKHCFLQILNLCYNSSLELNYILNIYFNHSGNHFTNYNLSPLKIPTNQSEIFNKLKTKLSIGSSLDDTRGTDQTQSELENYLNDRIFSISPLIEIKLPYLLSETGKQAYLYAYYTYLIDWPFGRKLNDLLKRKCLIIQSELDEMFYLKFLDAKQIQFSNGSLDNRIRHPFLTQNLGVNSSSLKPMSSNTAAATNNHNHNYSNINYKEHNYKMSPFACVYFQNDYLLSETLCSSDEALYVANKSYSSSFTSTTVNKEEEKNEGGVEKEKSNQGCSKISRLWTNLDSMLIGHLNRLFASNASQQKSGHSRHASGITKKTNKEWARLELSNDKKLERTILDPRSYQCLNFLTLLYTPESFMWPEPCVPPSIASVEFYSLNDLPLGLFLEKFCFTSQHCRNPHCTIPMSEHTQRFLQTNGSVIVQIRKLNHELGPPLQRNAQSDSAIQTWLYCPSCRMSSQPTFLFSTTWHLSFVRFIDLFINSSSDWSLSSYLMETDLLKQSAGDDCKTDLENDMEELRKKVFNGFICSCPHSVFKTLHHCFSFDRKLVIFKFQPVNVYEIVMPPSEIRTYLIGSESVNDHNYSVDDLSLTSQDNVDRIQVKNRLNRLPGYLYNDAVEILNKCLPIHTFIRAHIKNLQNESISSELSAMLEAYSKILDTDPNYNSVMERCDLLKYLTFVIFQDESVDEAQSNLFLDPSSAVVDEVKDVAGSTATDCGNDTNVGKGEDEIEAQNLNRFNKQLRTNTISFLLGSNEEYQKSPNWSTMLRNFNDFELLYIIQRIINELKKWIYHFVSEWNVRFTEYDALLKRIEKSARDNRRKNQTSADSQTKSCTSPLSNSSTTNAHNTNTEVNKYRHSKTPSITSIKSCLTDDVTGNQSKVMNVDSENSPMALNESSKTGLIVEPLKSSSDIGVTEFDKQAQLTELTNMKDSNYFQASVTSTFGRLFHNFLHSVMDFKVFQEPLPNHEHPQISLNVESIVSILKRVQSNLCKTKFKHNSLHAPDQSDPKTIGIRNKFPKDSTFHLLYTTPNIHINDQEVTSIIAYAMTLPEYERKLVDLHSNNNNADNNVQLGQSALTDGSLWNDAAEKSNLESKDSQFASPNSKSTDVTAPGQLTKSDSTLSINRDLKHNDCSTNLKQSNPNLTINDTTTNTTTTTNNNNNVNSKHANASTFAVTNTPGSRHIKIQFNDSSTNFFCCIYYASEFFRLRQLLMPNGDASFIQSLSRCYQWNARGGKSGSAFMKTRDERFVIKELSSIEMKTFNEISQDYFDYLISSAIDQRLCVLSRIVGIFHVGFKNSLSGQANRYDVLVMENLFHNHVKLAYIYDLKGSLRKRLAEVTIQSNKTNQSGNNNNNNNNIFQFDQTDPSTNNNYNSAVSHDNNNNNNNNLITNKNQSSDANSSVLVNPVSTHNASNVEPNNSINNNNNNTNNNKKSKHRADKSQEIPVLLDQNLLNASIDYPLYLRVHSKNALFHCLQTDTAFLANLFIMDYSLLVGVDTTNNQLVIGLIDYLRKFTLDKRFEMLIKQTITSAQGPMPTILTPDLYRERFLYQLHSYFPLVPDQWYGSLTEHTETWHISGNRIF